jgi:hypothetical protein
VKNPHLVTQILLFVLIGSVCWMGYQVGHLAGGSAAPSGPVQPAASALETAAKEYHDGLGDAFLRLKAQVKAKGLVTKQQGVDYFAVHRKPLGDALNATFDAHCDKDGNITDPDGLAADLDRPARALGAK